MGSQTKTNTHCELDTPCSGPSTALHPTPYLPTIYPPTTPESPRWRDSVCSISPTIRIASRLTRKLPDPWLSNFPSKDHFCGQKTMGTTHPVPADAQSQDFSALVFHGRESGRCKGEGVLWGSRSSFSPRNPFSLGKKKHPAHSVLLREGALVYEVTPKSLSRGQVSTQGTCTIAPP